jgi:predicted Zn-dependent protease
VKPLALGTGPAGGAAAAFEAQTEQGALRGIVSFVAHRGATYQLVGFTPGPKLEGYAAAFQRSFATFGPLTDPAALGVQPARIELVKVPRDMTIAEFAAQYPSSVTPEELAIANGVAQGGKLTAGQTAKRIVGGLPAAMKAGEPPKAR